MLVCESPKTIWNDVLNDYIQVNCGHCSSCLRMKSLSWVQRLEIERYVHQATLFVTLTFDNSHLPVLSYDDSLLMVSDEDTEYFNTAWLMSSRLIDFYGGLPFVGSRPFQLFIKRIRRYVHKHFSSSLDETQYRIRYFCCMEYGPTTFRPHYHVLLFFDNLSVAEAVNQRIGSFWSDFDFHTSEFTPIGAVTSEFVKTSGSSYVSEYLNCTTNLPPLLRLRYFRPCSYKSSRPPIGTTSVSDSQVSKILRETSGTFSVAEPKDGSIKHIPLWRSLEAKIFPKCPRFSCLSDTDKFSLYALGAQLTSGSYSSVLSWLSSEWPYIVSSAWPSYALLRKVILCDDTFLVKYENFNDIPDSFAVALIGRVKRLFAVSTRVLDNCTKFSLSLHQYVKLINEYYVKKDYSLLVRRLQVEQDASVSAQGDAYSLFSRLLPVSIASAKYDPFELMARYGFSESDVLGRDWFLSQQYLGSVHDSEVWSENSHKKRVRYEYLQTNKKAAQLHGFRTY